jgi:hypothetical protein
MIADRALMLASIGRSWYAPAKELTVGTGMMQHGHVFGRAAAQVQLLSPERRDKNAGTKTRHPQTD